MNRGYFDSLGLEHANIEWRIVRDKNRTGKHRAQFILHRTARKRRLTFDHFIRNVVHAHRLNRNRKRRLKKFVVKSYSVAITYLADFVFARFGTGRLGIEKNEPLCRWRRFV
jgi:hypothetical protein